MATSAAFCCAALLTAVPSARGGARLRLPAVRSRAPGAGFRGVVVGFTLSTMAPPPKPKVIMLVYAKPPAKATDPWDSYERDEEEFAKGVAKFYDDLSEELEYFRSYGDEDDDFDKYYAALCKQTEEAMTGQFITLPLETPFELSEKENALQNKLKEIAERCMDLQADAMRRLRPEQRRPLYQVFRTTHSAFTSVKVRAMEGHAKLGVSARLIVLKLDGVCRMVSSACSAPLPLYTDEQESSLLPRPLVEQAIAGLGGVDSNLSPQEAEAFALIEYIYNTVKSDVDKMITASATSTSS